PSFRGATVGPAKPRRIRPTDRWPPPVTPFPCRGCSPPPHAPQRPSVRRRQPHRPPVGPPAGTNRCPERRVLCVASDRVRVRWSECDRPASATPPRRRPLSLVGSRNP